MTTSNRKTRGYKEKSSMLAFGQIALPLAAIVALGLLFVGVKLFFLSPADKGAVEIVPETAAVVERPEASSTAIFSTEPEPLTAGRSEISRQESAAPSKQAATRTDTPVLAGPVSSSSASAPSNSKPQQSASKQQSTPKTQSAVKQQTSSTQKQSQIPTARPAQRPAQVAVPAQQSPAVARSSGFGVQIGAFTRREGADKVAGEAAKLGYKVSIVPTQSASGTFYRVRVQAGPTRDDAARTAADLEKKGYPVAIVAN